MGGTWHQGRYGTAPNLAGDTSGNVCPEPLTATVVAAEWGHPGGPTGLCHA